MPKVVIEIYNVTNSIHHLIDFINDIHVINNDALYVIWFIIYNLNKYKYILPLFVLVVYLLHISYQKSIWINIFDITSLIIFKAKTRFPARDKLVNITLLFILLWVKEICEWDFSLR